MNRKIQTLVAVAFATTVVACDGGLTTGPCVTDSECTVPGETCITPTTGGDAACGCDITALNDQCTEADANTVCHPDRLACETKCTTNDDCTSAGEQCDTATSTCRDPAKFKDCTKPGNECATTQICNTTTKACQDPCTATSCASGDVCNDVTKICEADCTVTDNCAANGGKVCDTAAKVCVDSCGAGTCLVSEVCDPSSGQCVDRCTSTLDDCDGGKVCNTESGLCLQRCDDTNSTVICESTKACSPASGLCEDKCTGSIDCAGGFCDLTSGLCETPRDITECNPEGTAPTNRQFVNPATNQCTSTSELKVCTLQGEEATRCPGANFRDAANAEKAAGPTIFNVTPVGGTTSPSTGCTGASVRLLVEYYDPTGGVLTSGNVSYFTTFQAVAATDSNTADAITTCKGETPDCGGLSSDDKRGAFIIKLCRPNFSQREAVEIYMRDGGQSSTNFGNSYVVNLAAQ